MKKRKLGRTGLLVSELGFGGIPLTRVEPGEAIRLVRYCLEKGITFFDTANLYGDSESKIGEALQDVRDQVILATKSKERDAEGAMKQIDKSLRRLKTNYIDLYQLHNVSSQEDLDRILDKGGAYEAMVRARDQGKIGFIGITAHNVDIAVEACRTDQFDTVQVPFNFIEHDPEERLFPTAREKGMGIIAMKPLGGGLLDMPHLCFGFLQQYEDVIPIAGVQAMNEVDENVAHYLEPRTLSPEDWDEIKRLREEIGSQYCHRCEYCKPCPEGVPIWLTLLFKAQIKRFPPEMVMRMNKVPMEKAENCVECRECEEKCPYNLPVPDLIKETLEHYREFCAKHG